MTSQAIIRGEFSLPAGAIARGAHSTAWWGMIILILNEAIIFASLLASYFYLRFNSVLWPPQGVEQPELAFSSINTVILIASSVVLQWAVIGLAHDNTARLRGRSGDRLHPGRYLSGYPDLRVHAA